MMSTTLCYSTTSGSSIADLRLALKTDLTTVSTSGTSSKGRPTAAQAHDVHP